MSTPERSANIAASSVQTPVTGVIPQHVIITKSDGTTVESFGGGTGGTASTDGESFAANSTSGTPAMGAYQSSPSALTDGDLGVVALDVNRNLKVNVAAGGTAGVQYTEGDTDATITGTAVLFESNTGTNALGVVSSATPLPVTLANTGANATPVVVDLGANNDVTITGTVPVNNAGTFATQETGAALTALQLIDNLVLAEDAAHGSGDPGVQLLAVRNDAGGTLAGATGDYAPLQVDSSGSLRVTGGGGGTEYTEGDVDTTFTGGVVLAEGPSNTATPLAVNASAHLKVDIATATVSVPVTDNSGSLTVDAPVGTPVFVRLSDGSAAIATLPVSLASVPSHAVTNAGTFVVQENGAALTSLQLIDDVIVADDAAFTPATTKVAMAGFTFDDVTPDSVNEGDAGAARMSANRNRSAQIRDNAGNERGLNVDANGEIGIGAIRSALPAGTNAIGKLASNTGVTIGAVELAAAQTLATVTTVSTLTGTTSLTPGTAAANLGKAEDAAHGSGDTGVMMLAVQQTAPGALAGTTGDYAPPQLDENGNLRVTAVGSPTGGHSIFRSLDLDETEEDVKTTPGTIYAILFTNTATTTRWLKVYNATAASVTVGSTTPVITFGLPGNATDDISGAVPIPQGGIKFDTAICVAATTGVADADTGAPAANDVIVNVFYR